MIESVIKLANMLDLAGMHQEADLLDEFAKWASNSTIFKTAKRKDIPIIATVVLLRKNGNQWETLIERRTKDPMSKNWALPGGHLEENDGEKEDYRHAAVREVKEETGINLKRENLTLISDKVRTHGKRKRDICYATIVPMAQSEAVPGSDAADAIWFSIREIPRMAFDHNLFIELSLKKMLGEKPEYHSIADVHLPVRTNQGLLIAVDAIDGAGKTTQIAKLYDSLTAAGYSVACTSWGSSENLRHIIKSFKKNRELPFMLYSLLYVADLLDRYTNIILPRLAEGKIVLCDRYIYTSYVRDAVRGVDTRVLNYAYSGFIKPDLLIYCNITPEAALERLRVERGIGHYGAGLDLNLSSDADENFLIYQKQIQEEYKKLLPLIDTCVSINTARSPEETEKEIWANVVKKIKTQHQRLKRTLPSGSK